MLNFVICKENISSTDNYLSLINAFMMKYDYDYKINIFKAFDDTWQDFIKKEDGFKIYLFFLENNSTQALLNLKKIRQEVDDWLSMILVIAPTTSALNIMTERLLILDYLNSDSNLKNRLFNDFKICLKNYTGHHKKLSYTYKNTIYNIEYRQIITIEKEIETKRCLINTDHGTYYTTDTLNNLLEKLDSRFLKCYRSLIINLEQIESYNLKTNTITFKNKETTFLVSRDKKKDIINYLREIN